MRRFFKAILFVLLSGALLSINACAPRKTKSTVDRVYELDPAGRLYIHPQLSVSPPKSLAVLPFRSLVGEGRAMGSRGFFQSLNRGRGASGDVLAEEMRLAFFGQLAQLPFELTHPVHVDQKLKARGLTSWDDLRATSPKELTGLLGVEALVFGEVIKFDYYYGLLYAQLAAGLRLEMISTTGEMLWRFNDTRRNHTVRIALDPISIAVGLFQAGFALRAVAMARAIDEICREAVATIPPPPVTNSVRGIVQDGLRAPDARTAHD